MLVSSDNWKRVRDAIIDRTSQVSDLSNFIWLSASNNWKLLDTEHDDKYEDVETLDDEGTEHTFYQVQRLFVDHTKSIRQMHPGVFPSIPQSWLRPAGRSFAQSACLAWPPSSPPPSRQRHDRLAKSTWITRHLATSIISQSDIAPSIWLGLD